MNSFEKCCLLSVGFFLLMFTGQGHSQTTNQDFELGRQKYNQSDWDGAITNFSKAIAVSFDPYDAYSYRAFAKSKLNDRDGASTDCAEVIKLNPANASSYFWCARIFVNLTNYDAALANYAVGMRLNPKDHPEDLADEISAGYYQRQKKCFPADDLAGTVSNLNIRIFLNPKNANAYAIQGEYKLFQGNFGQALTDANLALKYNRAHYLAHFVRAWARLAFDDSTGAIDDAQWSLDFIREKIKSKPSGEKLWKVDVLLNEALIALAHGDKKTAAEKFKTFPDAATNSVTGVETIQSQKHFAYLQKLLETMLAKVPQ